MARSYTCQAIILKRLNFGDADRIITLYTREKGKLSALAKGIRKINSRRAGSLEIGTKCRLTLHQSRSLDIISETEFLDSYPAARTSLVRATQMQQLLEIIDLLTVDNQPQPELFDLLDQTLSHLTLQGAHKEYLLSRIVDILRLLGFTHDKQFTEASLKDYIEELAQKKLRSKDFLNPRR